jgi:hypothetical protein
MLFVCVSVLYGYFYEYEQFLRSYIFKTKLSIPALPSIRLLVQVPSETCVPFRVTWLYLGHVSGSGLYFLENKFISSWNHGPPLDAWTSPLQNSRSVLMASLAGGSKSATQTICLCPFGSTYGYNASRGPVSLNSACSGDPFGLMAIWHVHIRQIKWHNV